MTMNTMLADMQTLFTSLIGFINQIIQMFFGNPVTFVLFSIPIAVFIILTVISILKALFK